MCATVLRLLKWPTTYQQPRSSTVGIVLCISLLYRDYQSSSPLPHGRKANLVPLHQAVEVRNIFLFGMRTLTHLNVLFRGLIAALEALVLTRHPTDFYEGPNISSSTST